MVSKKSKKQLSKANDRQSSSHFHTFRNLVLAHKVQILVFFIAMAVFFLRRTDALLNPQLFAEDGEEWLQEAFNNNYSPTTLFYTYAGYLAVFPRLVALISGIFPIEITPSIFIIFALLVQVVPLIYLWSARAASISVGFKALLTIFYLCLPFTDEIHGNITNSQWYLALILFILVSIREPQGTIMRWSERVFALIASLSGPFSIMLTPILMFESWRIKKIPAIYRFVFLGAAIQLISILLSLGDRLHQNIGLSVTNLLQIIGGQVFGAGLFGAESLEFFLSKPWIAPVTAILGIELLIYVFIKSNKLLRYFLAFATIVFVASLVSPNGTPPGVSWWQVLLVQEVGGRYFFVLHAAILACFIWVLLTKQKVNILLRGAVAVVLVFSLIFGVYNDFKHKPYPDMKYQYYIQQYRNSAPGQETTIPTNPSPDWEVKLRKE